MPTGSTPVTNSSTSFSCRVDGLRTGRSLVDLVDELLRQLTPAEKLSLLDGDIPFWDGIADMNVNGYNRTPIPMGRVDRLGIPGLLFSDGPRGWSWVAPPPFPSPMARGATWDRELEERVGTAIGLERYGPQGANFFGGVCMNLPATSGLGPGAGNLR